MSLTNLDTLFVQKSAEDSIPYLIRLKEEVMARDYQPTKDDKEMEKWHQYYCSPDYFMGLLAREDVLIYHIGSFREPAGMMILHRRENEIEVDDLLVLDKDTNKGFGRRMIKTAMALAEVWKIPELVVDIYPGYPKTEKFLNKNGFVYKEESSNDLGMPMMRYSLPNPMRIRT